MNENAREYNMNTEISIYKIIKFLKYTNFEYIYNMYLNQNNNDNNNNKKDKHFTSVFLFPVKIYFICKMHRSNDRMILK